MMHMQHWPEYLLQCYSHYTSWLHMHSMFGALPYHLCRSKQQTVMPIQLNWKG